MAEYNGHKNRNHWNVALWIANDEGLYRMALDAKRRCRTLDRAAEYLLDCLPPRTPDGVPYTKTTVRAALSGLT